MIKLGEGSDKNDATYSIGILFSLEVIPSEVELNLHYMIMKSVSGFGLSSDNKKR